jgi:hypothetical protein
MEAGVSTVNRGNKPSRATERGAVRRPASQWSRERVESWISRTSEEMAELKLRGDLLVSAPGVDLTNRSFSLAIDVGLYLAGTLERAYPQLGWKQFLDNKKFADYGQPVLTGFGQVPLNPIRIAVTLAYGLASGKQTGNRLREIFDYWTKQVSTHR